jgi:hemolysin activation/secretion protein
MTYSRQPLYKQRQMFKQLCRILVSLWLLASLANDHAWAASLSPTDNEEQNLRTRQESDARQQRKQQEDIFLQTKKQGENDLSLPVESPSFTIHTLQLEGDNIQQFSWLQRQLNQYAGRDIGVQGINVIVKRLTETLIDRGYITTRIVVPEQNLSSGILKLQIIPGKISNIYFAAKGAQGNWKTAFPARPGDILNLRQLEQGLEQMKRLPFRDVDFQLMPGKNPGESDVVITMKTIDSYKLKLSVDDSGTTETGKLQTTESLSMYDLFAINDIVTVTENGDGDRAGSIRGTQGDSVNLSVPYGDSTFSFSSSRYQYHQTVYGGVQSFISSGANSNQQFHLSQLLYRDQFSKTNLELGIIKKQIRSYLDDTEIGNQHQDTTAVEMGISHRHYFGSATLDAELINRQGTSWFGAQPDNSIPDGPTTRYNMWLLDTDFSTPVILGNIKGTYSFTFHGQNTNDRLYGTDFISIGNRFTVRGFDGEQTLSAERGWYVRNDLGIPLDSSGLEAYAGLDYGEVYGPSAASLPGHILLGSVLGVRGGSKAVQCDVFVGWALRKPTGFITGNPTYGFQCIFQI